jgi:t-SNARE complex subunit (syntaxin)
MHQYSRNRTVKPEATQEEITQAVSGGGDQVFMQAARSIFVGNPQAQY